MPHDKATPSSFESSVAANLEQDFGEVSKNIWDKVESAPQFNQKFNEQNVFNQMYFESARSYYSDATDVNAMGRAILKLYTRWHNVAQRFTRHVLRGDADNPLDANLDWDPTGGGEALVRPLQADSFANAQYQQTTDATGQFNIVPDNTQANGSSETATANEQAWMVMGYIESRSGDFVPYDYIQEDVNDNIGVRRPFWTKWQMEGEETLKVAERHRGPLLVEPGFDLDIDVNATDANVTVGLWPVGIEIIRADATEFGGVLDS